MTTLVAQRFEVNFDVAQETLPETKISSERATYRAKNYLARHVGMYYRAVEPVLLSLDNKLVCQVNVSFKMYDIGPFIVRLLDVDAETGDVSPYTNQEIETLRGRASAFVKLHTPSAASSR